MRGQMSFFSDPRQEIIEDFVDMVLRAYPDVEDKERLIEEVLHAMLWQMRWRCELGIQADKSDSVQIRSLSSRVFLHEKGIHAEG